MQLDKDFKTIRQKEYASAQLKAKLEATGKRELSKRIFEQPNVCIEGADLDCIHPLISQLHPSLVSEPLQIRLQRNKN